ncbi:MAG: hypothetical protein HY677_06165 [Chloroflexi bacterium]|nr:hypothetical protein [Chloroflexota bacterium]
MLRRTEPEVTADINSFLDTLLLFRLGSIISAKTELRPKSVLITGGKTTSGPQNVRYKYALTSVDVPDLTALFTKLKPLLQQIHRSTNSDAFSIGCRRFKEALLEGGTSEATITSGITCLEALLLGAGERQELKHRLGQRVSALASLLGVYDPLAVYRDISFAYEIRSTFIHGSVVRGEKAKMLSRLCEAVLNYSRLCLLVTVQLRGAIKKDAFLKTLDNSLLDQKQRFQLEQLLRSKVIVTM